MKIKELREAYERANATAPDVEELFDSWGKEDGWLLVCAFPLLLNVAEELENIVNAKRFSRDHFRDDTEYADWLQSRGRAALAALSPPSPRGSRRVE